MRKKPTPIETTELCHYGCGNLALFKNNSDRLMCCESSSACPEIRKKNSEKLKQKHKEKFDETGKRGMYDYSSLPEDVKSRMNWNKGNFSAEFCFGGKGSHKQVLLIERGHRCENCGLSDWMNEKITIEMDHIDGNNRNNEKDNLRLLCPNCHALTPTWRGRNKNSGSKKVSDHDLALALAQSGNIRSALINVGLSGAGNYDRCKKLISGGLVKLVNTSGLSPDASA